MDKEKPTKTTTETEPSLTDKNVPEFDPDKAKKLREKEKPEPDRKSTRLNSSHL